MLSHYLFLCISISGFPDEKLNNYFVFLFYAADDQAAMK